MRLERISMFALVSLLVIAVGAQSASAYTWTNNNGYDNSFLNSNRIAHWDSYIDQNVDLHRNDVFTWGNHWVNLAAQQTTYGWQWSAVVAYGNAWDSSTKLYQYGSASRDAQGTVTYLPYDGYPDIINLNHRYQPDGYLSNATDFLTTQRLTAYI